MPINRRGFLKGSIAAAATLTAGSWSRVYGANEDLRVGVVGFKSRGESHIDGLGKQKGVRIVALCDVDSEVLEKHVASQKKKEVAVEPYADIRKMLENKNIDIVSIATPNHWHSLMGIWSCQAGKDVYVEKPVSHNVWEGRKLVEAARKYDRIVQTGTQCRSSTGLKEAIEWVQAGNLGKLKVVRGLCYKRRPSIGKVDGEQKVSSKIDYDLWCGPAAKLPLTRKALHYDWHWVWNTGNGDLGNQGIHQMDIARWILGAKELSPRVMSVGGRLGYTDDGETPNTQIVYHDYPTAPLIFEVRGLPSKKLHLEGLSDEEKKKTKEVMDNFHGAGVGVIAHCEGGILSITSYSAATAYDTSGKVVKEFKGGEKHFENFIQAVRERKSSTLNADILEGHLSSALCHTGNISYRLGKTVSAEEAHAAIKDSAAASETFSRMMTHLGKNELKPDECKMSVGSWLKMDPKTERFIDNPAADAMLTREYRAPFVVPEKV